MSSQSFSREPVSAAPEDDGSVLWPCHFLYIFSFILWTDEEVMTALNCQS